MDKNKALTILELNGSYTLAELKKAYRKKALQYHPDINKKDNAKELFVETYDAYEFLLNIISGKSYKNRSQSSYKKSSSTNKDKRQYYNRRENFNERYKKARQATYEKMENEDKVIMEQNFIEYKNGWKRVYMKYLAPIAALISLLLIIDHYLPTRADYYTDVKVSVNHEFLGDVYYADFEGESVVIGKRTYNQIRAYSASAKVNKRFIFGDIKDVELSNGYRTVSIKPSFNIHQVFPIFNLIFFLPLISFFIEKPRFYFVFLVVYTSIYFVTASLVIVLANRIDTVFQ